MVVSDKHCKLQKCAVLVDPSFVRYRNSLVRPEAQQKRASLRRSCSRYWPKRRGGLIVSAKERGLESVNMIGRGD